jgi:hypothetical protein
VVRRQLGYDLGDLTWHRLDGRPDPDTVVEAARRVLTENAP